MKLKWIIGDFSNGAISAASTLPVIAGAKLDFDVNETGAVPLSIPKRALPNPADWKDYLKPVYRMVALIDEDKAWDAAGSVVYAGMINRTTDDGHGKIDIQAVTVAEYLKGRQMVFTYSGVDTAASGRTFSGATHADVMKLMIQAGFSTSGIPSGAPKPPQIVNGFTATTGSQKYEVLARDMETFGAALEAYRDQFGAGNEYRFVPKWKTSARTGIGFDLVMGTDSAPHINAGETLPVALTAAATYKHTAYGESLDSEAYATRIIGSSKADGTDLTVLHSGNSNDILFDAGFNPGVEVNNTQMMEQLTQRLNTAKTMVPAAGTWEIAEHGTEWIQHLGKMAVFTNAAEGWSTTARIVRVSFDPSKALTTLTVMMPQARYPRLPGRTTGSMGNSFGGAYPGRFAGGFGGVGGPVFRRGAPNRITPGGSGGGGGTIPETPALVREVEGPNTNGSQTAGIDYTYRRIWSVSQVSASWSNSDTAPDTVRAELNSVDIGADAGDVQPMATTPVNRGYFPMSSLAAIMSTITPISGTTRSAIITGLEVHGTRLWIYGAMAKGTIGINLTGAYGSTSRIRHKAFIASAPLDTAGNISGTWVVTELPRIGVNDGQAMFYINSFNSFTYQNFLYFLAPNGKEDRDAATTGGQTFSANIFGRITLNPSSGGQGAMELFDFPYDVGLSGTRCLSLNAFRGEMMAWNATVAVSDGNSDVMPLLYTAVTTPTSFRTLFTAPFASGRQFAGHSEHVIALPVTVGSGTAGQYHAPVSQRISLISPDGKKALTWKNGAVRLTPPISGYDTRYPVYPMPNGWAGWGGVATGVNYGRGVTQFDPTLL